MPSFHPQTLASWTSGSWTRFPSAPITGFSTDTRTLVPGAMFVALRTEKRDGHDFLSAATNAGAKAALVEKTDPSCDLPQLLVRDSLKAFQMIAREHRQTFAGPVVGVTGSAGKTSTKELITLLLGGGEAGVLSTNGNFNNHIGVPLTLTRIDPDRDRIAVVEAGIGGAGEMAPLADMIRPNIAVVTLVGPAHLEALGSLENVAREKSGLAACLGPDDLSVWPASCGVYPAFTQLPGRKRMVCHADEKIEAKLNPVVYSFQRRNTCIDLSVTLNPDSRFEGKLPLVSEGMVSNAVLALVIASELGVDENTLRKRLEKWKPAALRGDVFHLGKTLIYLDCYNANPASMLDALKAFADMTGTLGRRCFILGGMEELGAESAYWHQKVGAAVPVRAGDRCVLVGAHSAEYREGLVRQGVARAEQIEVVTDLNDVKARLTELGEAIFIKGSRRYQLETLINGIEAHPSRI